MRRLQTKTALLLALMLLSAVMAGCGGTTEAAGDSAATVDPALTETDVDATAEIDGSDLSSPIVDTNQGTCYDTSELVDCPAGGEAFYGQDAQYTGNVPSYTDNEDGTVTDNVTGLVWTQDLWRAASSSPPAWKLLAPALEIRGQVR